MAKSFVKIESNYRCMIAGKNILQFSLPTFEYFSLSMNVHVTEPAYVEASIDNGTTWKHIIEWKHPGRDAEKWEEFYASGIMGLGWDEVGDLSSFPSKKAINENDSRFERKSPGKGH